jgi:hypothetical protein
MTNNPQTPDLTIAPAEDLILKGLIALFCVWGIVWFAQVQ